MNRNPVIPFIVIMVLGIGLMLLLSFKGLGDAEEIANGGNEEKTEEVAFTPEGKYESSCLACHGADHKGSGAFPNLIGVGDRKSDDEIKEILTTGKNNVSMPKELVTPEEADEMVKWLKSLK